jgi:hypothetical protein
VHGSGGIGDPFTELPIIGSEDIWESPQADRFHGWKVPRNGVETMRAAWGIQMAGVIPLYDEWNAWTHEPAGNGEGEPYMRRLFDFWHGQCNYRRHLPLNELVSRAEQQIASGIPGEEYLVYDQDGGTVRIDLAGASGPLDVQWFNPASGDEIAAEKVEGGQVVVLTSPFEGDSVLLIKR